MVYAHEKVAGVRWENPEETFNNLKFLLGPDPTYIFIKLTKNITVNMLLEITRYRIKPIYLPG